MHVFLAGLLNFVASQLAGCLASRSGLILVLPNRLFGFYSGLLGFLASCLRLD